MVQTKSLHLLQSVVLFVILFFAAWLPRAAELDRFVTPDERRWLQRSGNFYYALAQGDYASTYQAGHPGVTIMWAGVAGLWQTLPSYPQQVTRPMNEDDFDAWVQANSSVSLLDLLVAGRRWVVLAISLVLALTFLPLSKLLGRLTAFVALLFVAWEPFYIGLSRQLHPDGLVATFTLFALVSYLAWLYHRPRHADLLLAGIATGLAVLTKSPALIVPFVLLLPTALAWLFARNIPGRRRQLLWVGLLFGLYSAITYIVVWPATWSSPHDTFMRMFNLALEYSEQGHELPLYFWGQTLDDPGLGFYPVSYLMRATPATLFGLVCAALALWRSWPPLENAKAKATLIALITFAAVYIAIISLSAKKMDRYLLPAMPALTVVAAAGWMSFTTAIGHFARIPWRRSAALATLVVGLLLLHAAFSVRHFPYYLTYYNPLLGGNRTAPDIMMIGWGEGLEEAAAWLNRQPLSTTRRVVAWYGDGPLSYYLDPAIEVMPFFSGGDTNEEFWFDADYAVLYVNQWQRENPTPDLINYFLAQPAAYSVSFAGLDLVRIYSLRAVPPPDLTHLHRITPALWNSEIELLGYYLEDATVFSGQTIPFALFWRGIAPIAQDYTLQLSLVDAGENAIWSETRSPAGIETSDWPVDKLWRDSYTIAIPSGLPTGDYALVARFQTEEGAALPYQVAGEDTARHPELTVATLTVPKPTVVTVGNARWQSAALDSVTHVDTVGAGAAFFIDIAATATTNAPLKLSLRLLDQTGGALAQNDQVFAPDMRFRLLVPPGTKPGSYPLSVVLYDPATLAPLPDEQGRDSVVVSAILVR